MANKRIIHCMYAEKFIEPFIGFLEKHFDISNHFFLIKTFKAYHVSPRENIKFLDAHMHILRELFEYFVTLNRSEKIIIHGLFNPRLVFALAMQPWLLKKCYWIMWGGDLYFYELREKSIKSNCYELMRAFIIRRFRHFVTYTKGDFELAKKWYGVQGTRYESIVYLSNLYREHHITQPLSQRLNILVGNSANPTNNHLEIFNKLAQFKNNDIQIFCPLSYGHNQNTASIIEAGKTIFGEKFTALTEFMAFEEYIKFLGTIDIAVFNQSKQQGLGNMISLLGMGKKVYLNSESTLNILFKEKGIKIFDAQFISIQRIEAEDGLKNIEIIKKEFSEESLRDSLESWLT